MHLTNYAVNSKGEHFNNDAAEDVGTKRTLQVSTCPVALACRGKFTDYVYFLIDLCIFVRLRLF